MARKDELLDEMIKWAEASKQTTAEFPELNLSLTPDESSPENKVKRVQQLRMLAPVIALAGQFDRRGWKSVRYQTGRGPYTLAKKAVDDISVATELFDVANRNRLSTIWGLMTASLETGFEEGFKKPTTKKVVRKVQEVSKDGTPRTTATLEIDEATGTLEIFHKPVMVDRTFSTPVGGNIPDIDLAISENMDTLWSTLLNTALHPDDEVVALLQPAFKTPEPASEEE